MTERHPVGVTQAFPPVVWLTVVWLFWFVLIFAQVPSYQIEVGGLTAYRVRLGIPPASEEK